MGAQVLPRLAPSATSFAIGGKPSGGFGYGHSSFSGDQTGSSGTRLPGSDPAGPEAGRGRRVDGRPQGHVRPRVGGAGPVRPGAGPDSRMGHARAGSPSDGSAWTQRVVPAPLNRRAHAM